MRKITNLLSLGGRVWVYLSSTALAKTFLKNAEDEGFTFGDGVKPTERQTSDIFALNPELTIHYVGYMGHLAFQSPDHFIGEPLTRVDYEKYLAGRDDYVF